VPTGHEAPSLSCKMAAGEKKKSLDMLTSVVVNYNSAIEVQSDLIDVSE
jgi:hypothetical protein